MKIKFVTENAKVTGFRYFWLKYIRGFDPTVHCAKCLIGDYSQKVSLNMPVNTEIELNEFTDFKCLYLCGVIGYRNNLHIPFVPSDNENDIITAETYRGDKVIITGAFHRLKKGITVYLRLSRLAAIINLALVIFCQCKTISLYDIGTSTYRLAVRM